MFLYCICDPFEFGRLRRPVEPQPEAEACYLVFDESCAAQRPFVSVCGIDSNGFDLFTVIIKGGLRGVNGFFKAVEAFGNEFAFNQVNEVAIRRDCSELII